MRDADRIIGLLESENIFEPKLIINRAKVNMMKKGDMLDIDEICSVLAIDLLGIVPDDETIIKAATSGEPAVMNPESQGRQLPIGTSPAAYSVIPFRLWRSRRKAELWGGSKSS